MALAAYESALQTLLHDQAGQLYPVATLQGFINEARVQIALEGECIRGIGPLSTVVGQTLYQNNTVAVPSVPAGVASSGLITPKSISFAPGIVNPNGATSQVTLEKRSWDWFNFYVLGIAAPPAGQPAIWCPFTIGGAFLPQGGASGGPVASGSFYLNTPNSVYTLQIDGAWLPQNLAADTDPEAIPGPWTDAVPLYGQYLAYMDSRLGDLAEKALQLYEVFMTRARGIVTPLSGQDAFPGGPRSRQVPGQAPLMTPLGGPAQGAGR